MSTYAYKLDQPIPGIDETIRDIINGLDVDVARKAVRLFLPNADGVETTPEQEDKLFRYAKLFVRLTGGEDESN